MLLLLPPELLEKIFSYLDGPDVHTLLLLGFSPLLVTRLTSPSVKFIPSRVLEKLPRLRTVEGYIFIFQGTRILSSCTYYLKNFSFPAITPFFRKDVTLITTSPSRCRMIQRQGDFILLYNYPVYKRYVCKELPYIWQEDKIVTLGRKRTLLLGPLVQLSPKAEKILGVKITFFSDLYSRLLDYLTRMGCRDENGISVRRFPLLFYEELTLLATKKHLGSYLTPAEIKILAKFFTLNLNPLQEALLHRLENFPQDKRCPVEKE